MTESHEKIVRLFRDGHKLESILSGWQLSEERLADLVIQAYRSGETINPDWLAPNSIRQHLKEVLADKPELTNVQVSSLFKGRIKPALVHALRVVMGEGRGLETQVMNEETFAERFHDDLHGARQEILVVVPEIKGSHWRRFLEAFMRVIHQEGQVVFFTRRVSNLIEDDIKGKHIEIIEKHSNANLVMVDRQILWEGSMNFLLPPEGEEHVRRTLSRLQCVEILDIHDLEV